MPKKPTRPRYEILDDLFLAINSSEFLAKLGSDAVVEIKVMSNEKQLSLFVEKK